ncbi:hypothetical protein TCAL_14983 [Tigriopus californicus]|uniref:Uncharacterized protein n=1 Tax=Tigriopus californicus TaxID=6832 RepID=A0A553N9N4_TIGCA|nr:hypothetical protein TCAL_14983 [Tigriopus californicus]
MSSKHLSTLRTLSEELETKLEPAIKASFGIKGRPIMITQNSPKQIRITKDGIDICNSFSGHVHPLLDHILQHIRCHHHILKYCDGSKTIVLKVASLIRVLDKNLGNISSSTNDHIRFLGSVSRELDRFRSLALPKIVESLRVSILESADTSLSRYPQSIHKSMIKEFLDTRLNPTVARHLVSLIAGHFANHQNIQETIQPICFAVGNASVDESIYVDGFPLFSNGPKKVRQYYLTP